MEAIALRSCTWNCDSNVYELVEGEKLSIKQADVSKAKASGFFKEVKTTSKTKAK